MSPGSATGTGSEASDEMPFSGWVVTKGEPRLLSGVAAITGNPISLTKQGEGKLPFRNEGEHIVSHVCKDCQSETRFKTVRKRKTFHSLEVRNTKFQILEISDSTVNCPSSREV